MNNHNLFLRNSVYSLSKKSISHEHLNITDIPIGYQPQLFPLFHIITFSSYIFFGYIWKDKKILIIVM